MAKFAGQVRTPSSQLSSTGAVTVTHEGGTGFTRDPKSDLFVLAAASMVGEATFYEDAAARDERLRGLVAQVAATDPGWIARFVPYLRTKLNMRSVSVVVAAEYALATRPEDAPSVRGVVSSALQRADEPGEFLAYWRLRTGKLPTGGVKRGVADAVARLFTQRSALKYDGTGKVWRLGDVIEMMHPTPKDVAQGELFRYLLDRRHHPSSAQAPESLRMLVARQALVTQAEKDPAEMRRLLIADPERAKAAGVTWENLAGMGAMDAAAWEAIIPSMGVMALVRNLRNFDEAGVSEQAAVEVVSKLMSAEMVAASRMFPFRFLQAYRAVHSLRWGHALETAINHSLANVPALPGRSLVLVDASQSMSTTRAAGEFSELMCRDVAAIFGVALAQRAVSANLVRFGGLDSFDARHAGLRSRYPVDSAEVPLHRGGSLLKAADLFPDMGGTYTARAVQQWYNGHDRVVVITDEQAADGDVFREVPAHVPCYTWNVAGHEVSHARHGGGFNHPRAYLFGGLSDAAFSLIPLLETGKDGNWPF